MRREPALPLRLGLIALVLRALWFRRLSVGLTILTLGLSVALYLSVSRLQTSAKASFLQTVSGLDLIVAPRDSDLNVLLYSVFGLGAASSALPEAALGMLRADPDVAWAVPAAMGDSHRGYQVLGTSPDLFQRLRLGSGRSLALAQGRAFAGPGELVLGAEVARKLGYGLGDSLVLSHGLGLALTAEALHSAQPFQVVGILARSGSPFDRRLYVALDGMDDLHPERFAGEAHHDDDEAAVNFAYVGLRSPALALRLRAKLQESQPNLVAVLPGLSLAQLWGLLGQVELVLKLIAGLVLAVALLGLVAMLVSTLSERRREMAVFRALGARPWQIAGLLLAEAGVIALFGLVLGLMATQLASALTAAAVAQRSGLVLAVAWPTPGEALALLAIFLAAVLAALIPALRLYWQTLADGLSPQG